MMCPDYQLVYAGRTWILAAARKPDHPSATLEEERPHHSRLIALCFCITHKPNQHIYIMASDSDKKKPLDIASILMFVPFFKEPVMTDGPIALTLYQAYTD